MAEWEKKVKRVLLDNGYYYLRNTKGSHEAWTNGTNTVIVPKTVGRNLANVIMIQAEIDYKFK